MVKIIFFTFISLNFLSFAQENDDLIQKEIVLNQLLSNLRSASDDDSKISANQILKDSLLVVLENKNSFTYSFKKLKSLGVIDSPDNTFRLFTWNVELEDLSHIYECVIMRYDERKKEFRILELKDQSAYQEERPEEILNQDDWYGALYYQIVPFEKGNKDMYLVMGWDGFTAMSNRKILDVLYFSGNQVKLGSPVFKNGNETKKRIFFEFAENATMSLRWDDQYQRVLMDHLSPESSNLKGFYAYYVPDMSYDAYVLEKGKWYLKEDVVAINKKTAEKIEIYIEGDNGEIERKKIKNTWENPSDGNSPNGGNKHVAETPENIDTSKNSTEKTRKKKTRTSRAERSEKSNIYPLNESKKK
ncbi:MAG: hypothetical protein KJ941_09165, partial [Bacteroidetes bacterium]|nr:hypothetical protein [Bacteroidota bacterium]